MDLGAEGALAVEEGFGFVDGAGEVGSCVGNGEGGAVVWVGVIVGVLGWGGGLGVVDFVAPAVVFGVFPFGPFTLEGLLELDGVGREFLRQGRGSRCRRCCWCFTARLFSIFTLCFLIAEDDVFIGEVLDGGLVAEGGCRHGGGEEWYVYDGVEETTCRPA